MEERRVTRVGDVAPGNVTKRFFSGTTGTLSYDLLDHFTEWNAGSTNREWYIYDASGQRVLRRSTNSSSTTLTVYAFGLQEYAYAGSGTSQGTLYYYSLGGRPIGSNDGTTIIFYLTDGLANFNNTTSSAVVKANRLYGPSGSSRYTVGTINKETVTERAFLNNAVHVITDIQFVLQGDNNPLGALLGPRSPATGTLNQIFDPQQYNDESDVDALALQARTAMGGSALAGAGIGAYIGGEPGAMIGGVIGAVVGLGMFVSTLFPT